MTFYVIALIFFIAGAASAVQAIKHARTTPDRETGKWFLIGMLLIALAWAVWAITLIF